MTSLCIIRLNSQIHYY